MVLPVNLIIFLILKTKEAGAYGRGIYIEVITEGDLDDRYVPDT